MLDFHGLITSYVAYFSTWQPHENRISVTRFISLINRRDHNQNISDQRRAQGKKKKKNPRNRKKNPGSAAMHDLGQAARTVCDPRQQSLHPPATMAEVEVSRGQAQNLIVLEHQSDLKRLPDPVWRGRL